MTAVRSALVLLAAGALLSGAACQKERPPPVPKAGKKSLGAQLDAKVSTKTDKAGRTEEVRSANFPVRRVYTKTTPPLAEEERRAARAARGFISDPRAVDSPKMKPPALQLNPEKPKKSYDDLADKSYYGDAKKRRTPSRR